MSVREERQRALHILSSNAFAGLERHTLGLVSELRELGCEAELACPRSATLLCSKAQATNIPVRIGLAGLVRARPTVVHVHDGRSAVVGSLLAEFSHAAFVRTQHFVRPASVTRGGWRGACSVTLQRLVNHRLDGYIAVSHAVAEAARVRREIRQAELTVIPPGITPPAEEAVTSAKDGRTRARVPVVSSVGRLEPERRFDVLLDAIPEVLARIDCQFVIAGSGSLERELRHRAHELGVERAITWTGWLSDVADVLMRSHVYVNTLPFEGFGMATAEAMSFAVPVVAPRSGASAELVEHKRSGLLVPPADPGALATAICRLLDDSAWATALGDAGRTRSLSLYSPQQAAASTLAFYRRLTQATPRP